VKEIKKAKAIGNAMKPMTIKKPGSTASVPISLD
jgi:hypothetical protein